MVILIFFWGGGEGGILHFLELFYHISGVKLKLFNFVLHHISVVMVYYIWMSVTSNLHSKFLFLLYFATFFNFYPIFWLKIQNIKCYPPIS